MDLKGKVALVTGASSGIGEATAKKLAAAGVRVGIAARRGDRLEALKQEIEKSGGEALAITMNVADTASVNAGVKKLLGAFGRVDIVVNNAGVMHSSRVDSIKADEWLAMVDVNIKGTLNVCAAVLPTLKEQHCGHIINVSSIAGRKVLMNNAVYCGTKHAVSAFSEGMRIELGKPHNIRVTVISPGAVKSELLGHISETATKEAFDNFIGTLTPLEADDIADTVLFATRAPERMNVAEIFVLPTDQQS